LGILREVLEYLIDLILETSRKHLVGLIETEDFNIVSLEGTSVDHIEDSSGSSNDDMDTLLQLGHIFSDISTADTSHAVDIHVVAQRDNDLLNLLGEFSGRGEDKRLRLFYIDVNALED